MILLRLRKKLQFPYSGYRWSITEMATSALAINLLSLAIPLLTLQIYDRILQSPQTGTLYTLTVGVLIALLFEMGIRILQAYNMLFSAAVCEHALIVRFVEHFLCQKTTPHPQEDIGQFLNKLQAIGKLKDLHSGQIVADLVDWPFILLFLCLIALFGKWLVLAPVSVMLFVLLDTHYGMRHHIRSVLLSEKAKEKKYHFLIDTLQGVHAIKSAAWESHMGRRFETLQASATQAYYQLTGSSALLYESGIVGAQIMMVLVATLGAPWVISGQLTLGGLTACVMLSGRLMQMVQKIVQLWIKVPEIHHAYSDIKHYLKQEPPHTSCHITPPKSELRWENVSQEPLLSHFTLQLSPGNGLLVDSAHPAYESVFISWVLGQTQPANGSVLLDGIPSYDLDSDHLASRVAYLPPSGQLFKGNIEENISCFGQIPKQRVYQLAVALGIEQEINKLSAGFETAIEGDKRTFVPPGIRQGIAICRALGPRPGIVIFHHADSTLDPKSLRILRDYLSTLRTECAFIIFSRDPVIRSWASHRIYLGKEDVISSPNP